MDHYEKALAFRQQTAFFTGHRFIPDSESGLLAMRVDQALLDAYKSGYRRFLCGCALGFDTLAALRTIRFREDHPEVRLVLAIPCSTQSDRWSARDRAQYRHILEAADEKTILFPQYQEGCMLTRNRYMAEQSSLCICYLRHFHGGTAYTVRYALSLQMTIDNLAVHAQTGESMRENPWNYTSISPSANKNAVTATSYRLPDRKRSLKPISILC